MTTLSTCSPSCSCTSSLTVSPLAEVCAASSREERRVKLRPSSATAASGRSGTSAGPGGQAPPGLRSRWLRRARRAARPRVQEGYRRGPRTQASAGLRRHLQMHSTHTCDACRARSLGGPHLYSLGIHRGFIPCSSNAASSCGASHTELGERLRLLGIWTAGDLQLHVIAFPGLLRTSQWHVLGMLLYNSPSFPPLQLAANALRPTPRSPAPGFRQPLTPSTGEFRQPCGPGQQLSPKPKACGLPGGA